MCVISRIAFGMLCVCMVTDCRLFYRFLLQEHFFLMSITVGLIHSLLPADPDIKFEMDEMDEKEANGYDRCSFIFIYCFFPIILCIFINLSQLSMLLSIYVSIYLFIRSSSSFDIGSGRVPFSG